MGWASTHDFRIFYIEKCGRVTGVQSRQSSLPSIKKLELSLNFGKLIKKLPGNDFLSYRICKFDNL